jgi:hypothetical protein
LFVLSGARALGQTAPADESVTLHAVLVGDTNDPGIGKSVEKDLQNMENILRAGFQDHKDRLTVRILKGEDFTLKNVLDALRNLRTDGSETILVFFACHGIYLPGGGHTIAMDKPAGAANPRTLFRSDLRQELRDKRARLAVLLTDTCNSYPRGMELRALPTAPEWETMRCLFLLPRGLVDLNSVSEGESAYGDPLSGGFFTFAFTHLLREKFARFDANQDKFLHWEELLPRLQTGPQATYERLRRDDLAILTDMALDKLPADKKAKMISYRDRLRKQSSHSVRVYSLPRFGVRVLDNPGGGARVSRVLEYTPAALAGLKPGDIIKRIGDRAITDAADFHQVVDRTRGEVLVEYQRAANLQTVRVKIAPWPVPDRDG